ncbi:MAG: hypothetical protein ACTSR1_11155 [Candidatus Heimdallarchaeota archaeon]
MKSETKKWIFFSLIALCVLIWIIWTIFFPLFVDERLFLIGDLSGIPVLNPFYGLSIPIGVFLIVYLIKQGIKIKKGDNGENQE